MARWRDTGRPAATVNEGEKEGKEVSRANARWRILRYFASFEGRVATVTALPSAPECPASKVPNYWRLDHGCKKRQREGERNVINIDASLDNTKKSKTLSNRGAISQ